MAAPPLYSAPSLLHYPAQIWTSFRSAFLKAQRAGINSQVLPKHSIFHVVAERGPAGAEDEGDGLLDGVHNEPVPETAASVRDVNHRTILVIVSGDHGQTVPDRATDCRGSCVT